MRKPVFTIFIAFLFTCCQSTGRFIHFDQSCVSGSDHGEIQVFVGNDSCGYFKKTIRTYQKTDFFHNSTETMTLMSSALLINKKYYNELKNILKKYTDAEPKDCVAFYTAYSASKKVISQSSISKSDYIDLKSEIRKLNTKYNIDKKNTARIEWYFSIVDFDNGIKNGTAHNSGFAQ